MLTSFGDRYSSVGLLLPNCQMRYPSNTVLQFKPLVKTYLIELNFENLIYNFWNSQCNAPLITTVKRQNEVLKLLAYGAKFNP